MEISKASSTAKRRTTINTDHLSSSSSQFFLLSLAIANFKDRLFPTASNFRCKFCSHDKKQFKKSSFIRRSEDPKNRKMSKNDMITKMMGKEKLRKETSNKNSSKVSKGKIYGNRSKRYEQSKHVSKNPFTFICFLSAFSSLFLCTPWVTSYSHFPITLNINNNKCSQYDSKNQYLHKRTINHYLSRRNILPFGYRPSSKRRQFSDCTMFLSNFESNNLNIKDNKDQEKGKKKKKKNLSYNENNNDGNENQNNLIAKKDLSSTINSNTMFNLSTPPSSSATLWNKLILTTFMITSSLFFMLPINPSLAEDELAKYAQEGNKVGVDGACFMQKCSLPSSACAKDMNCLKGLQCLSKCKGEGTCSTSCFAKYDSPILDKFLHCAIEEENCVHVPKDESRATWLDPEKNERQIPPLESFQIESLEGKWYKVMGMDARYDCFDCQVNKFTMKNNEDSSSNSDSMEKSESNKEGNEDKVLVADVSFRMPRKRSPGYGENHIVEDLIGDGPNARRSMHSVGEMFGLTFWENWSVIGEGGEGDGEWKFIYYNGHTLQGNYEGAFVYSRSTSLSPTVLPDVYKVARANKLDPTKFCKIRNTCFLNEEKSEKKMSEGKSFSDANKKVINIGSKISQSFASLSSSSLPSSSVSSTVVVSNTNPKSREISNEGNSVTIDLEKEMEQIIQTQAKATTMDFTAIDLSNSVSSKIPQFINNENDVEDSMFTSEKTNSYLLKTKFDDEKDSQKKSNILNKNGRSNLIRVSTATKTKGDDGLINGMKENNSWFQKLLTMFQNIELEISDWIEDPKKTSTWLLDQQELMGDTETPPYADLLGGGEEVGNILRDE